MVQSVLSFQFSNHFQDIGGTQIPDSPSSIWDETRKSEYSQLYLDFAPYFQDLRTETGLEPCDKTKQTCTEPASPESYLPTFTEPFAEGVSAEALILDRWFFNPPYLPSFIKFLLQGTHKFRKTEYGKRRIDLLDFFRHAFRPHIYTYRPSDEKLSIGGVIDEPENDLYDQQMRFVFINMGRCYIHKSF